MRVARIAALTLVCASLAASARAADDEKCPTWFPDFQCDRQGRWEGFTAPVTMPFYSEEPFVTTGVYTQGIWNDTPNTGALKGGPLFVVGLQARVALTDKFGFVLSEDGYGWMYPESGSPIASGSGWMNYMFGFKYAIWQSKAENAIVTLSLRYKTSWSSASILQQGGKGGFIPGLSFAWGADKLHLIAGAGGYMAVDGNQESSFAYYNIHLDYAINKVVSPFVELNGISYSDDGNGSRQVKLKGGVSTSISNLQTGLRTGPFDGVDLANLGSNGVGGQNYITAAVGLRCRLAKWSSLGIAYERPITNDHEITKQRGTLTLDFEL